MQQQQTPNQPQLEISQSQKVVSYLKKLIHKLMKNEKSREEVEQFALKHKKYASEIASEIFNQTEENKTSTSLPQILNLVDSLCKKEREIFVQYFEDKINKIFQRVYKNVKNQKANTKSLIIMRKTWLGLFSNEKLDQIRRSIFKIFEEDIDTELSQQELQELRQYYIESNIHSFEEFLQRPKLKNKKPTGKHSTTIEKRLEGRVSEDEQQRKKRHQEQKVETEEEEKHKKAEPLKNNNKKIPILSLEHSLEPLTPLQSYSLKLVAEPQFTHVFLDLFKNYSILNQIERNSDCYKTKENIQDFIKNKPNELIITDVTQILLNYSYRCSFCRLRFKLEQKYLAHIEQHADQNLDNTQGKKATSTLECSLNEEVNNLLNFVIILLKEWLKSDIISKNDDIDNQGEKIICSLPYDALKHPTCLVCQEKFQAVWDGSMFSYPNVMNVQLQSYELGETFTMHYECYRTLEKQEMNQNINHPPQTQFIDIFYSDGHYKQQ